MTNVSTTGIWEFLANGGDVNEFLKDVPGGKTHLHLVLPGRENLYLPDGEVMVAQGIPFAFNNNEREDAVRFFYNDDQLEIFVISSSTSSIELLIKFSSGDLFSERLSSSTISFSEADVNSEKVFSLVFNFNIKSKVKKKTAWAVFSMN